MVEGVGELHRRIGHRFARSEARERVKRYLAGLLGRVERKNGWQLAEAIGERDPQGVQRLLNSAEWDADEVRDDLREYVLEHLGDEETGVLIVDETGLFKKGEKSVGVARQSPAPPGTRSTAKLGCFWRTPRRRAPHSSTGRSTCPGHGRTPPPGGRRPASPRGSSSATKSDWPRLWERAFEAGVSARWVAADSFYGRSHAFRGWLEERARPYAVMVPRTNAVPLGGRKKRIEKLVERLGEDAFSEVRPARDSGGGRRPWEWACLDLAPDREKGMRRWLLVRRSTDDPDETWASTKHTAPKGRPWRNW